jgi:ankyrin repeat protein
MNEYTRIVPVIKVVSEFTTACYSGDIELVKFWGTYRSDVFTSFIIDLCYNDEQLFYNVCENGHLNVAKWLYNLHPYVLFDNFDSIFNIVYKNGYLNMLKWVVKKDPEYIEDKTKLIVPFWESCLNGKLNIAKWIHANSNERVYSLNKRSLYYGYKRNMLLDICGEGNLFMIKWLLTIIPSIEDEADTMEIFNKACVEGKLNIAKCIINRYPNINISAKNEETFRLVCSWGQVNIAKWLLKIKPDIDISAKSYNAFYQTCKYGYLEMAKWLLKIKPDINNNLITFVNQDTYELFTYVCRRGYLDVAKWLYELHPYDNGLELCDAINFRKTNPDVIKWILETMPYVCHFGNRVGLVNAFENCCWSGDIELVMMIYNILPDYIRERPLITSAAFASSCCSGNIELVNMLLNMFDNIDISINDELAFISACANGHLTIAKLLLELKPDIDISARDDKAFQKACVNGHLKVSEWLEQMFPDKYLIGGERIIENDTTHINFNNDYEEELDGIYRNNQGDIVTSYTYEYTIYKPIKITKTIPEKDIPKQIEDCSICLLTKSNVYTDCSHLYCESCISKWLNSHDSCPLCRAVLSEENMSSIVA